MKQMYLGTLPNYDEVLWILKNSTAQAFASERASWCFNSMPSTIQHSFNFPDGYLLIDLQYFIVHSHISEMFNSE
jgi:hypothetical protein